MNGSVTFFPFLLFVFVFLFLFLLPISFVLEKRGIESPIIIVSCEYPRFLTFMKNFWFLVSNINRTILVLISVLHIHKWNWESDFGFDSSRKKSLVLGKKKTLIFITSSPPFPLLPFSPSKTKKNTLAQKKQGNGHNKSPHNDSRHEFILKGVIEPLG